MSETWLEKREWERLKERLPRGYEWEIQLARRKNRKGRVIGGMVIGIRNGVVVLEEEEEREDGENNDEGGEDRGGGNGE